MSLLQRNSGHLEIVAFGIFTAEYLGLISTGRLERTQVGNFGKRLRSSTFR